MTEQILQTINQSISKIDDKISKYQDKLESTNINVAKLEGAVASVNDAVTRVLHGVEKQHKQIDERIDKLSVSHADLKNRFGKQNRILLFTSGGLFVMMQLLWPRVSGFFLRFLG